ncbi:hypothetical protein PR202_gb29349 [Eleusine coracana subsp. coracana]|uniref:Uncharacterized protein n=1 Tax=Eleusine coracana subsp. coracana TaxID=191504 RepID=A0AAV5G035_ELECO|nr:hypothetical protein PR202_gb29349 [Eleusine coracana subsp. coracana]
MSERHQKEAPSVRQRGREAAAEWTRAAGSEAAEEWARAVGGERTRAIENDGLLAFVNNFLKEHFLPAIFVDYRKCVQHAISSK